MENIREIKFEKGSNNILISAPHCYIHKRNNRKKSAETNTLNLIQEVKKITKCHIVYINQEVDYDPNYNIKNNYKDSISKYIKENDIKYFIDVHGMKDIKGIDIELGTNYLKNINKDKHLLLGISNNMKNNTLNIKVDRKFKATKRTLCEHVNKNSKIPSIQLEFTKSMRIKNLDKSILVLSNLVEYLTNYNFPIINFQDKYDELLDIKPNYNYERKLGVIPYNYIGIEIEVSVNYKRDSYSFIKKLLSKIKVAVGENGYFVKDNTIKGSYNFEIILDPLPIDKIIIIYTKIYQIIEFSDKLIESSSKKNCGLHANFNKKDVSNLSIAHKNMINLVLNNSEFFDNNRYKQKVLIWEYEKYLDYQKDISGKYVWINYSKEKIIEIRNIKAGLTPNNLEKY